MRITMTSPPKPVTAVGCCSCMNQPAPAVAAPQAHPAPRADDAAGASAAPQSLRPFFEPRTIAVVGASRDENKIGGAVLASLLAAKFSGTIYPVNANATEVRGLPAFARVKDIHGPIDLAIIAVPAEFVEEVVDQCIAKSVHAVIVLTAGYSERGDEGRQREQALVEKIRSAGMRLIGPNCLGLMNTDQSVRLNASFTNLFPPEGSVALLSQSGALGVAILDYVQQIGLGLSTFVSVGNKADVSGNDLLEYWETDERTKLILLYLESFGNPKKFSRIARRISPGKPIIAVKSGRSKSGERAVASHTGALAGSDRIVDAMFKQTGVIRTDTLEEMFDVAALLANQPVPRGNRVAILTNAGGPGIMAADACEARGLSVTPLSATTETALRAILSPQASVANPIDMIATATPEQYGRAARLILDDPNIDSLMILFVPILATHADAVAAEIVNAVRVHGETVNGKTVLASFMGEHGTLDLLRPIPSFRFPESAAAALARATAYGRWRSRPIQEPATFHDFDGEALRAIMTDVQRRGGGWLTADECTRLLQAARLKLPQSILTTSIDQAIEAAHRIGFPVAMKATSPSIIHKTEFGGVRLSIRNEHELREAFDDLTNRLADKLSGGGILVQQMITQGAEFAAGVARDPKFGPVIMFGSGGTTLELFADVSFRLHPLTDQDVIDMLREVKGSALLRGFRGGSTLDEGAVRDLLLRMSHLLTVWPEIQEIDFNPVKVQRRGLSVIDARIRVAAA